MVFITVNRDELKEKYGEEEVLVVPKEFLPNKLNDGFTKARRQDIDHLLSESYFIKRYDSDNNPDEVEVIPYVVVTNRSHDNIFCTKRLDGSGEKRLIDLLSLGQGGHINPFNTLKGSQLMYYSLNRELAEELMINPIALVNYNLKFEGYIRKTETTVDKDHLGFLFFMELRDSVCNKGYVSINETDVLEGEFVDETFLDKHYDKLETWSRVVIDNL